MLGALVRLSLALFFFQSLLKAQERNQEPTSIWENIISLNNTLLSFAYKKQHLSIWKVQNAQTGMDEYFVSPIPQLIPSSFQCQNSFLTDSTKLVFQVEMWSNAIQEATIEAIHQQLNVRPNQFQVHPLPFHKIRLTRHSGQLRNDDAMTLHSKWLSNSQKKFQQMFYFSISTMEVCEAVKTNILASPGSLANELTLEGMLSAESCSNNRTLSIKNHHIITSKLFADLINAMETEGEIRYLQFQDVNRLAEQTVSRVIAMAISDADFVPAEDELNLQQLLANQLRVTKDSSANFTQDQWDSVFWEPTFARPDKMAEFLQKAIIRHDEVTNKYKWDKDAAIEWAQRHDTDLRTIGQHFGSDTSSVHRKSSGSVDFQKLFVCNSEDISKKEKSTNIRVSSDVEEEGKKKGSETLMDLTEAQMNSWLEENNIPVQVQDNIFCPKPVVLWRLNLHDFRQTKELLNKQIQIYHINMASSFQVGVKGENEQQESDEEAKTIKRWMEKTVKNIDGFKITSEEEFADLKETFDEELAQWKSSVNSTKPDIADLKLSSEGKTSELNSSVNLMKSVITGLKQSVEGRVSAGNCSRCATESDITGLKQILGEKVSELMSSTKSEIGGLKESVEGKVSELNYFMSSTKSNIANLEETFKREMSKLKGILEKTKSDLSFLVNKYMW